MKTILPILFFFCSFSAFSQYNETIYLKNGSIVRGRILEIKPDDYVKFKTEDGNYWVFKSNEIEKFDLTDKLNKKTNDSLKTINVLCDLGFLVGSIENEMKAPLSFMARINYRISKQFYFGLGSGLEFFQMTYVPVYAELRFKPESSRVSIFFQGGETFPFNSKGNINSAEYKYKRGYFINPGISYTFDYKSDAAFIISIGYRYQKTDASLITSPQYYYSNDYSVITRLNRFSIRLGYIFR